jgi:hypothetical protein
MSTKTADDRLAEMHHRIDELEAKTRSAGAGALKSITYQVGVLRRQEESARTALREARDERARKVAEHAHATEDKVQHLEARLKEVEHAFAAEVAEDKKAFTDAMTADLADFKALFHELDVKAATMTGRVRSRAEAAITELRGRRDVVAERLRAVREASEAQWRERKQEVNTARAELERKLDEVSKKFE